MRQIAKRRYEECKRAGRDIAIRICQSSIRLQFWSAILLYGLPRRFSVATGGAPRAGRSPSKSVRRGIGFSVGDQQSMAGTTGLEPATSDVTGRRSNQLNYVPALRSEEHTSEL